MRLPEPGWIAAGGRRVADGVSDALGRVSGMPGAFVVFEGGDGAGKSTQCRLLADALTARGREVVRTREPGGTPIGEAIRTVLLGAGSHQMSDRAEALLFAAARAQHAAQLIRPGVRRGAVVLSDRYLDSSVAYQGAGRGLGEEQISELSLWATDDLVPELTVLLDVAPGVGLGRAAEANRMEAEPESFHALVRESFLRRAAAAPQRYLVLPADLPVHQIAAQVLDAVLGLLDEDVVEVVRSARTGVTGTAGPRPARGAGPLGRPLPAAGGRSPAGTGPTKEKAP